MQIDRIEIEGIPYDISVKDRSLTGEKIADHTIGKEKLDFDVESTASLVIIPPTINYNSSNGNLDATSALYCTTKSVVSFPYKGLSIKAVLPDGISCIFYYIRSTGLPASRNSGTLANGESFTPGEDLFFRCKFFRTVGGNLASADVNQMIDDGTIRFEYSGGADVITRNLDKMVMVGAARRCLIIEDLKENDMDKLPLFGHISDLHGDAQRLDNCLKFCEAIGADAVLGTGDSDMNSVSNFCDYQEAISKRYTVPYLFIRGNHEVPRALDVAFETQIQGLANMWNYLAAPSVITTETYYYKDFPEKKIRVIGLDYYHSQDRASLGQDQVSWFIARLADTPAGFGVIVMIHSPEGAITVPSEYAKFNQARSWAGNLATIVGDRIVTRIVDAFISRGQLYDTYTDAGVTVTVNADFANVADGVEFICVCNGHRHEDRVGYIANTTNLILNLNITSGSALYGVDYAAFANQEDLPRGGEGVCQDAFNVFAIDRRNGVVKIVRIGANMTDQFEKRDYMSIPYNVIN